MDSLYYSLSIGAKSHSGRSQSSACLGRGLALTPTSYGDKLIMPYKERLLPWWKSALAFQHVTIDCWLIPNSRITKRTSKADRLSWRHYPDFDNETLRLAAPSIRRREHLCNLAPTGLFMPQTNSTPILETLQRGSGRLHAYLATSARQRLDFDTQRHVPTTPTALATHWTHLNQHQEGNPENSAKTHFTTSCWLLSPLGNCPTPTWCSTVYNSPVFQSSRRGRSSALSKALYPCGWIWNPLWCAQRTTSTSNLPTRRLRPFL